MKRTLGFQKDDTIFKSEEFTLFNEFTEELPAVKVFEYAKEIQKNCHEDQYPQAWTAALRGARTGLDEWEESGATGKYETFLDDGIITELYAFLLEQNGGV